MSGFYSAYSAGGFRCEAHIYCIYSRVLAQLCFRINLKKLPLNKI